MLGEAIGDADIEFLERVLKDAKSAHALVDRHPEVQSLATKLTAMYQEIVD